MNQDPDPPLQRFLRGMPMDLDKWRDGTGHDLGALAEASPEERVAIEAALLAHRPRTWREVEALAALATPRAEAALREALDDPDPEVRLAVARHVPAVMAAEHRTRLLVEALESAEVYAGLTQALDQVAEWHPPAVERALWRGLLTRSGEVAVHFAAMLAWIHGQASAPFDWDQRPFFLRFNTENAEERQAAFHELAGRLGSIG